MSEQAVIVTFRYAASNLEPLRELEDKLRSVTEDSGTGEYDGNDMSSDLREGTLYFYGTDARSLFEIVNPILSKSSCVRSGVATLRFGPPEPGVAEEQAKIG